MKDSFKRKWQVMLYFFLMFLSLILLFATFGNKENSKIRNNNEVQFNTPWAYDMLNGKKGFVDNLPATLPDTDTKEMILSNTLTQIDRDISFFFKARHTKIRILIDGIVVYDQVNNSTERDTWLGMPGSIYHEIEVSRSDSGKQIVIESYCDIDRYLCSPGKAYLGDRGSFILSVLSKKAITIFCAFALIVCAIALFIAWMVIEFVIHIRFNEGLCLSLFTLSIALWLFTETQFSQFIFKNSVFITVMAYEILMLTPVPIALFFSYGNRRTITKRLSVTAAVIPMVVWIINNSLHFLGISPLGSTLRITQVTLCFELLFVAGIQISEIIYARSKKDAYSGIFWKVPLIGIGILVPLGILEICKYIFTDKDFPNDGLLITIGIMFYILALSIESALRLYYVNVDLKTASEEKTQFLANMSHDLRTPLNAILGFNEMILRDSHDEKITAYSSSIQSAGASMKEIINSILDISKIESGKLEIYSVEYNLVQLLDNVISITESLAQKKGLTFTADIDGRLPEVLIGDETHIRQILLNILNNAVKYTENGGVTFTVKLLDEESSSPLRHIFFSVKDTGIGIRDEDRQRLFEKFERLDENKNYNVEGTGLGMSIVVNLLKAMNSKIELITKYGKGSDFYFTLEQCVVSGSNIGSFEHKRKNLMAENMNYTGFIAPKARILIVDDLEMNLNVACALLEHLQMHIDTAQSGKIALEQVKNTKYDIILMDHMMPEMDGIEVTIKIRELAETTGDPYYASVPIIALTANVMVGMKETFIQSGMQDFISKPVGGKTLIKIIKRWLPKNKLQSIDEENNDINTGESEDNDNKQTSGWDDIHIDCIDIETAKLYNAGSEMFINNLKDFYGSIDATKDKLNHSRERDDVKNYTINVHGLKSTAKLIGAVELSQKAWELEQMSSNNQVPDVWNETDKLFEIYDRCKKSIGTYLDTIVDNSEKKILTEQEFLDLMKRIKVAAQHFDMMEFMSIEEESENWDVEEHNREVYNKLIGLVKNTAFLDTERYLDGLGI